MDIKNDKEHYGEIIGITDYDTKKVEETVSFFLSGNADYEFRTTLINEFHKDKNIEKIGEWIKGAKRYFLQKFKSGDNCLAPAGLSEVPKDTAENFIELLKKDVPSAKLRGY
ncbi:MAG: hypothetical protein J5697_04105 [Clostridia bacterium]|nr:hypothetical protein [Clostridia bacterium]